MSFRGIAWILICCVAPSATVLAQGSGNVPAYVTAAAAGEWTQIGSNSAADVRFTGWGSNGYPNAGGNFNELFGVWAGAAYDPNLPAMYFTGGGHGSYDGNEIYAFRFDTNQWHRVSTPSPYVESQASDGLLPDGLPQAIHTYGEMESDQRSGIIYRLGAGGSQIPTIWSFDPSAAPWPMDYDKSVSAWRNTGLEVANGYGIEFAWDATSSQFIGGTNERQSNFFSGYTIDMAVPSKTPLPNHGFPNGFVTGNYASVAVHDTDRTMYVVGGGSSQSGSYVSRGTVAYRIDAQQWVEETPNTQGDKTPETVGGGGLTYDSLREVLWFWKGTGSDSRWLYQYHPGSKLWIRVNPGGPSPAPAHDQGLFNKFRYIAAYDVIVAVGAQGGSTANAPEVWMYKPADWQEPGPIVRPNPPENLTTVGD